MDDRAALDELDRILAVADEGAPDSSLWLPAPLCAAAAVAVEHFDAAPSAAALVATALRRHLETLAMETALRLHDCERVAARPSLAEVALALAAQDGSPLAERPDLIAAAASAVVERHPTADADDVLLWAQAQLAAST